MTIHIDPINFEIRVTIARSELRKYDVYMIADEMIAAVEAHPYIRQLIKKEVNNHDDE